MNEKAFEQKFLSPVKDILMTSRETAVNYSMPLGLHHIFAGSHYGPGPWERSIRPDWSCVYYHKAGEDGIGFDRTRTGSDNVDQYNQPLADEFNSLETCPENLLLWFHHVPWDYTMHNGNILWDELCRHYDTGISQVEGYIKTWESLKPYVSQAIFEEVSRKLDIQKNDAQWWRDACVGYFQKINGRDISRHSQRCRSHKTYEPSMCRLIHFAPRVCCPTDTECLRTTRTISLYS